MEKNLHNIDELFKNGLDSHQEEVPTQTWEGIAHKLDAQDKRNLESDNKRLRRIVYWLSAACVAAVIVIASNWNGNRSNATDVVKSNQSGSTQTDSKGAIKTLPKSSNNKGGGTLDSEENNAASTSEQGIANEKTIEKSNSESSAVPLPIRKSKAATKEEGLVLDKSNPRNLRINKNSAPFIEAPTDVVKLKEAGDHRSNKLLNSSVKLNKGEASSSDGAAKNSLATNLNTKNRKLVSNSVSAANEVDYQSLNLKAVDLMETKAIDASIAGSSLTLSNTGATPIRIKSSKKLGSWDLAIQYGQTKITERVEDGFREHREDDKDEIKKAQSAPSAWNATALVNYKLKNGLFFTTGLGYSVQNSSIEAKPIFARRPRMGQSMPGGSDLKFKFNCTAGYALIDPKTATPVSNGDSVTSLASKATIKYVTVPLGLGYQIKLGKLQVLLQTTVQANILAGTNLETNLDFASGTIQKQEVDIMGLKKTYFSGNIAAGVAYELVPRASLYFMPQAGFSLGTITKDAPTSTYTSGLSWQTGIKFSL